MNVRVCLPWFTVLSATIKNGLAGYPIGAMKGAVGKVLKLAALAPLIVKLKVLAKVPFAGTSVMALNYE